jgi:hypothetical protein
VASGNSRANDYRAHTTRRAVLPASSNKTSMTCDGTDVLAVPTKLVRSRTLSLIDVPLIDATVAAMAELEPERISRHVDTTC